MFAKLHIQVDRDKGHSRAYSLNKSIKTLASGRSVMVFPEGGILTKNPPHLHLPLQKGAFIMAIQRQVPLVPVTLHTNHQLLPDKTPILGMSQEDVPRLMEMWREVVEESLNCE